MSEKPQGSKIGIFGLFFREAGLFSEQAFKWVNDRADEFREDNAKAQDRRRIEAEAKLLEQARLAKSSGVDVNAVLASSRKESPKLK